MTRHITIRMAWHDNKWNGRICRDPQANIHCIGNYSLLSTRIQRRRRPPLEQSYKDQEVSKIIEDERYVPPCYWSINASGNKEYVTTDPHPFADVGGMQERFSNEVPPIVENLKPFSVFTWYFRLGYAKEGSLDLYVPRDELKERVEEYLHDIEPGKSIGLLYANYSNPVTGDKHKYLLLGAGLAKEVYEPKEFNIPDTLFNDVTSRPGMRNFPRILWRFQLEFDPNTLLLLPYHEYLDRVEGSALDQEEEQKKLEDVAIPIDEDTMEPNFKYVCRPLSSSKCLYALYLIERSLRKMKEHGIVEHSCLKDIEVKLSFLMKIAWRERGKYPGFRNLIQKLLSTTYPPIMIRELVLEIHQLVTTEFGGVQNFLQSDLKDDDLRKIAIHLRKAFRIIERDKALVEFLSLFDFSRRQFDNAIEIVSNHGLETIKKNPYILLEDYVYEPKDSWRIDESDYGVALFEIDMALIPDPRYVDWDFPQYDALSPERLRSVVATILYDAATRDGMTYLSREEILDQAKEYPLYYIHEGLEIDAQTLSKYEKQTTFKDKFAIIPDFRRQKVLYQLNVIGKIEETIALFVNKMAKKKHTIDDKDSREIEAIIRKESEAFKEKLDAEERRVLYENAMRTGLFVLTGKAGSGKTTAIRNLVEKFKDKKKLQIFIFTPTGKASLVVKNRLRDLDYDESQIRISTIHRFLFTAPFEYKDTFRYKEIHKLRNLIERILGGKIDLLDEFESVARDFIFTPKVVIIDEASMVDEVLLALLFSLINPDTLEHLLLVGDEKQLPPIGIGRPLTDVVFNLKKTGSDQNLIHLESDLRFPANKSLGNLASLLIGEDPPTPADFQEIFNNPDETIKMECFSNLDELQDVVKRVLAENGETQACSIFEMFRKIIEEDGTLNLDEVQILAPRRYGSYGSEAINIRGVLQGEPSFRPGTKLICEENIYHNIGTRPRKRILGLANGSIGYVKDYEDLYFEDIEDLAEEYGHHEIYGLKSRIMDDLYSPWKTQTRINFGYAITVHKSQGSDFSNVILVLSEVNPFITKELLYTAITRPRKRIYLVTHADLTRELHSTFAKAYSNSEVEKRRTLLFGEKDSPFKPFYLVKKDGKTIQVMSKIEYIIAKALDDEGVAFEAGPREFLREHHLIPDFRLSIDGESYYWEHLGSMHDPYYRERWYRKFRTYCEKIQIADKLVTTSEDQRVIDTEGAVRKIVSDLRFGKLTKTEGAYSHHHYYI
jgi:exodeoxyribonuclease V alpha subunit